ncbi:hypothetical protein [Klenkia brasiliensis]|uniref:Uncharacterized protein n=1 Tax=Klenkia brasiliensis TaxID=333142 RepID=A0A1G7Q641_9ACTN|nr:hypothetical protein [Klenkia brasiliensis]SDF94022.1 hypothetical protein SAMN05660324_1370 [Klenkia brasiliensis]
MGYTLLNPSAVGFDVVRRPAAARVASVLLVAATATPALLADLAARHPLVGLPAGPRRAALAESVQMREIRAASFPVLSAGDDGGRPVVQADPGGWDSFALGGAHELGPYVCEQLLGPGALPPVDPDDVRVLAADLLAEAVVGAWTAGATEPADDLYRTVRQAASTAGRPAGLGPNAVRVVALLDGLPTGTRGCGAFLRRTRGTADPVEWATAMQEAAWAAWLSGRERPAVAAQMLAVIALADRGIGAGDLAARVWNLVSGMVAVAVVQDLLPDATVAALAGPAPDW